MRAVVSEVASWCERRGKVLSLLLGLCGRVSNKAAESWGPLA